jgi:hypothetical protein
VALFTERICGTTLTLRDVLRPASCLARNKK